MSAEPRWLSKQTLLVVHDRSIALHGDKRTAFLAAVLFLRLNGRRLRVGQAEAVRTVLAVAQGNRDIAELAKWIDRELGTGVALTTPPPTWPPSAPQPSRRYGAESSG